MDNKSYEQFLIMLSTIQSNIKSMIEANRQETDEKQMNTDDKITKITEEFKFLT